MAAQHQSWKPWDSKLPERNWKVPSTPPEIITYAKAQDRSRSRPQSNQEGHQRQVVHLQASSRDAHAANAVPQHARPHVTQAATRPVPRRQTRCLRPGGDGVPAMRAASSGSTCAAGRMPVSDMEASRLARYAPAATDTASLEEDGGTTTSRCKRRPGNKRAAQEMTTTLVFECGTACIPKGSK
ncbi:unnamed protein product [Symbiodinium sp. CCMP2592]|nr:unnamed protein product [Symbiodinium sp. CCMP2592]